MRQLLVPGLARGLVAVIAACAFPALASTPETGTLTLDSGELTYTAGPGFVPNPSSQVGANECFDKEFTCDVFVLTVDLPDDYATTHPYGLVSVSVGWPNRLLDFEVFVYDESGKIVAGLNSSNNPELMVFPPSPGKHVYEVTTFPNIATGDTITGHVALVDALAPYRQTGLAPVFADHKPAPGLATDAGEPSLYFDPYSGKIMFEAGLQTLRVTLDRAHPGQSVWEDVSSPYSITSLDPILAGDRKTGRTFVSQLLGITSLLSYSDDDGRHWTGSEGAGIPGGVDHQTVGAGPYPEMFQFLSSNPLYPNAVYYCSQDVFTALCARSDDGGVTFAQPVAIYGPECAGIHGHVKVAPDGTVYVPARSCSNGDASYAAAAVSTDAGITWTVHTLPGALAGQGSDATIGIGSDGTVYLSYEGFDGHLHVADSHDRGTTWENDTDVTAPVGVQNTVFPAAVAGDPDRAAVAFLGTTTRGTPGSPDFPGEWYLYVATTYDGGLHWKTVNATPGDPVQRAGGICLGGITCGDNNRNLLDFIDATIDDVGRILVGYADGCVEACVQGPPNTFASVGSVVAQIGGPRLLAAFDPPTVQFRRRASAVGEDAGTITLRVTLSPAADHYVIVPVSVSGRARNGEDYTMRLDDLVLAPGTTVANLRVKVIDDALDEDDEKLIVTLGQPVADGAILGARDHHVLTIVDNDPMPVVSLRTATLAASEGADIRPALDLSAPSGRDITIPYTLRGTATPTDDYIVGRDPLVIRAGTTVGRIPIAIVDDAIGESDETAIIDLGTPDNATLGTPASLTLKIRDND